jgi:hypothetical protein
MLNVLLKMMFNCCKKSYFCFDCCVQVPVGTIMLFNINMHQEVLPEVQQEVLPLFCGKCCQEYGKKCCQEGSKKCCQKGSKIAAKSAANMFALVAQRASHEGCNVLLPMCCSGSVALNAAPHASKNGAKELLIFATQIATGSWKL